MSDMSSNTLDTQRLARERTAVETLYRAFNEQNPDLVDLAVTADWDDIPLAPGQGPGPEGIKPIIREFVLAMPDVQIIVHDLLQLPGRIAVRAEIRGTHQGVLMGIAPTGKQISFSIHEFHELDGERVTRTWHLEDWFGAFMQMGSFPTL